MRAKYKALLYNFLGFAVLFILIRLLLGHYFNAGTFVLALVSALVANLLAPKFGVVKTHGGERLFMKWVFRKGVKEL
ncbi:MAG: hypothetical protein V7724_13815 [Sediminicola sp.]